MDIREIVIVIANFLTNHWNDVLTVILSGAALFISLRSERTTRKEKSRKRMLYEDHEMAQPLFRINLKDYIDYSEPVTHKKLLDLFYEINPHLIHFHNKTTQHNYRLLMKRFMKLIDNHPEHLLEKGMPQTEEEKEKYIENLTKFVNQWHSFIHKTKVRTSVKDV